MFDTRPLSNGVAAVKFAGLHGPHHPTYMSSPYTDPAVPWRGTPRGRRATSSPSSWSRSPFVVSQTFWPSVTMWSLFVGSVMIGEMNRGNGSPGEMVVYVFPPLWDS